MRKCCAGLVHNPIHHIVELKLNIVRGIALPEFPLSPRLPPCVQVVATFSQRSEVKITPVKSKQQSSSAGSPSSLADAGSLSYPSLPESGEEPLPSSSSSSSAQRPPGSVQKVGDEHMFHQKVIFRRCFSPPLLPSCCSYLLRVVVLHVLEHLRVLELQKHIVA